MAIITKSGSVDKGADNIFTLNKTDLANDVLVAGDAYFSVQSNWSKVAVIYLTTEGDQRQRLYFDTDLASPTSSFSPSANARDVWEVQSLIIYDNDEGSFILRRDDLTVADFDVEFASGGSITGWGVDNSAASYTIDGLNAISGGSAGKNTHAFSDGSIDCVGKKYFEIYVDAYNNSNRGLGIMFRDTDFAGGETFITANENYQGILTVSDSSPLDCFVLYGQYVLNNGVVVGNAGTGLYDEFTYSVAIDFDNNKIWFGQDGVFGTSAGSTGGDPTNPATGIDITAGLQSFTKFYIGMEGRSPTEMTLIANPTYLPAGYEDIIA